MRAGKRIHAIALAAGLLFAAGPVSAQSFAGSARCEECHADEYSWYMAHAHAKAKGAIPNETGIGCEACHGTAINHVYFTRNELQNMAEDGIPLEIEAHPAMNLCGACHGGGEDTTIALASDYLIGNMQSYDELMHTRKVNSNTCMSCHNPHASIADGGVNTDCAICHTDLTVKIPEMAGKVQCMDCHMPLAVTTGKGTMVKDYQKGEKRAHLYGISIDPAYKLNDGSGKAAMTSDGLARLTVEMTCYSCHRTGAAPAISREELFDNAARMH